MNLANTFPRHSGLILSFITGAFDSSPAIFLVYRLLYQSSFGPILFTLFIMPSKSYTIASVESVDRVMNQDERVRSPSSVSEAESLLWLMKRKKETRGSTALCMAEMSKINWAASGSGVLRGSLSFKC
ncbi:Protein FMP42 [Leucoagaricus sp. SymC.cos]|nr:Protein FMP42 [Leucoagaricus sp. SymC.cos]